MIAQNLYTDGYISYPRTSSQVLPKEIGYKKLIQEIGKQAKYSKLASELLSKQKLEPNNGKKTDPAHPAIYPTGIEPKNLDDRDAKIYDLIVKRFLATFADTAVRETLRVEIDVNKEIFVAKGTTTIEKGWHAFYEPYSDLKEERLPQERN
jgi:DNA topoisomerase-1